MTNLLTRKLEMFGLLPEDDKAFLEQIVSSPHEVGIREDIIGQGQHPEDVHLILEGFACRYKIMPDGSRQIFAYLVPGDFCDLHVFILKEMDHGISTLSPCSVVDIPRKRVLELTQRPAIARALWWVTLVDEAILREWLVNLGGRQAEERVAHLFCELHLRLSSVGLVSGDAFSLPITQADLADTLGLSGVHVNRILQRLRERNLIVFRNRQLYIPNVDQLREMSGFNPLYLHLDGGKHDKSSSLR